MREVYLDNAATMKKSVKAINSEAHFYRKIKGDFDTVLNNIRLAHEFSHLFTPVINIERNGNMFKPMVSEYRLLKDAVNAQIRDVTKEKEVLAIDTWRALTELDALAQEYRNLSRTPSKK